MIEFAHGDNPEEVPREYPSVRFRKMDIAVIGAAFATELAGAVSGALGNLTFSISAHRNWMIDQDRALEKAAEPEGVHFKD